METKRNSKSLKQARSFTTKQKIIDAAYKTFCKNGYYKTTSIEISKEANVSIGCFYSYFKDKDAVFFEILDIYNKDFLKIFDEISSIKDLYKKDKEEWLLFILNRLIDLHKESKDFNRELSSLYRTNSAVNSIINEQHNKIIKLLKDSLVMYKDDIHITDIDAATLIIYDIINSIVDRVVFKENELSSDRILNAGIEAVNKYLYS